MKKYRQKKKLENRINFKEEELKELKDTTKYDTEFLMKNQFFNYSLIFGIEFEGEEFDIRNSKNTLFKEKKKHDKSRMYHKTNEEDKV